MKNSNKANASQNNGKTGSYHLKKIQIKKDIIDIFYKDGLKTIADLCELTNNSIPSTTNIMNELVQEGWVHNVGIGESKGGRKPAVYDLNTDAGLMAAIDISRNFSRLGIFNLKNEQLGNIIELQEGLETSDNILALLKEALEAILEENQIKEKNILGLGLTIPGLIDIKTGVSYSYSQFGERPLREFFRDYFDIQSTIEHDTKAMAVGESWFGRARGKSNVLFINIGSGIGLAILINGELYHGHSGFCGEFGHIQMDPDGDLCYCGKIGCLETIASGTALVKKSREEISGGKSSIIRNLVDNNTEAITLNTIIEAANQGDLFAIELIEEAGEHLAKGISILIHLFNPETIIIGGEMSEAGNLITDPIQQKLNKYTMLRLRKDSEIILSALKEKAGLYGTLPLIFDRIIQDHFAHSWANGSSNNK
ncbi:MAG: ROK family protein [Bacteroidales bacterium]